MIVNQENITLEQSGASATSGFSIAMTSKAFRVLSDGLYKNKIGSLVREISTNALDAHVAAGKREVPFEIHLPDAFEPWFSVKDYGIGLSDEDVKNIYSTYFKSTKDTSNLMTGSFGLGSKTPFAYSDTFNITSVKDGIKRIYSAFIAENGMPSIALMVQEDTEEGNGVEITVSVKQRDFQAFKDETCNQLRFFNPSPILKNATFEFSSVPCDIYDNAEFKMGNPGSNFSTGVTVVQGSVGYPIEYNEIAHSDLMSPEASSLLYILRSYSSVLYFNIGEINVTASRENVEYVDSTIKAINAKLLSIKGIIEKETQKNIESFGTAWEKLQYISSNPFAVATLSKEKIQEINKYAYIRGYSAQVDFKDVFFDTQVDPVSNHSRKVYYFDVSALRSYGYSGNRNTLSQTGTLFNFNLIGSTRFFVSDGSYTNKKKIEYYNSVNPLNAQGKFNSLMISFDAGKDKQKEILKLKEALGDYNEIIDLSAVTLPKKERKKTTTGKKSEKTHFWSFAGNRSESLSVSSSNWYKEKVDVSSITEPVIYLTQTAGQLQDNSYSNFRSIADVSDKLICIRSEDEEELKKTGKAVPYAQWLEGIKKGILDNKQFLKYRCRSTTLGRLRQVLSDEVPWRLRTSILENKIGKISQVISSIETLSKKTAQVSALDNARMDFFGVKVEANQRVLKKLQKFLDKYKMLKYTSNYTPIDLIESYIALVESK